MQAQSDDTNEPEVVEVSPIESNEETKEEVKEEEVKGWEVQTESAND